MRKKELIVIAGIVLLAFVLRLYKIDRPIADWHSWRQADTAAVARNFIKEGFNPFIPKYDDMSSQANALDNPNRYRFVEFPIYNSIVYFAWLITGVNTTVARLITVFATLGSTVLLYLLVRQFSGSKLASISALFFATLPYNVFYSSTILPAPFMVFCLLALYVSFVKFLENQKLLFLLVSIIFSNLAILSWPIALFFMPPLVYLAWNKYKLKLLAQPKLWLFAILSISPFLAWRIWMLNFPEGIPYYKFLLNESNIRFKGAFFRWLIAERLGTLILTTTGVALFLVGLIQKSQGKEKLFYYVWLISVALYFTVFASGNVRHDYYQIPAIPILCIFLAKGSIHIFNQGNTIITRILASALGVFFITLIFAFGFFEVKGFYWVNKPQIIEAGTVANSILPHDAKVIAPYNGDTAFLYHTNRYGYPLLEWPIEKLVKNGAKYLVSVDQNDDSIKSLARNCNVIYSTESFTIIELSQECII